MDSIDSLRTLIRALRAMAFHGLYNSTPVLKIVVVACTQKMEFLEKLQFDFFIQNIASFVDGGLQTIHYVPNRLQQTAIDFQNYFPRLEFLESATFRYQKNSNLRIPISYNHFDVLFLKKCGDFFSALDSNDAGKTADSYDFSRPETFCVEPSIPIPNRNPRDKTVCQRHGCGPLKIGHFTFHLPMPRRKHRKHPSFYPSQPKFCWSPPAPL